MTTPPTATPSCGVRGGGQRAVIMAAIDSVAIEDQQSLVVDGGSFLRRAVGARAESRVGDLEAEGQRVVRADDAGNRAESEDGRPLPAEDDGVVAFGLPGDLAVRLAEEFGDPVDGDLDRLALPTAGV